MLCNVFAVAIQRKHILLQCFYIFMNAIFSLFLKKQSFDIFFPDLYEKVATTCL